MILPKIKAFNIFFYHTFILILRYLVMTEMFRNEVKAEINSFFHLSDSFHCGVLLKSDDKEKKQLRNISAPVVVFTFTSWENFAGNSQHIS